MRLTSFLIAAALALLSLAPGSAQAQATFPIAAASVPLSGAFPANKIMAPVSETGGQAFMVRGGDLQLFGVAASPLADMGRQGDWSDAFFATNLQPRAFAVFGAAGAGGRARLSLDHSLRAGFDARFGEGELSLRLTGAADTRADFAGDPALAPMAFFASSDLLSQSMLSSATLRLGPGRLMLYGASSLGAALGPAPFANDLVLPNLRGVNDGGALGIARTPMRQTAVGAGYWMRPDGRTVVGVTLSAITQRHGFYDLATNVSVFNGATRLFNFGLAASRSHGEWDLFAAAEVTALRAPKSAGPVGFTEGMLVSGEIGVRRSNLLIRRDKRHDAVSVTLRALPQAVRGSLELNYTAPPLDDMGPVAVSARTPLAGITGRTVRVETSYAVAQGQRWSIGVSAGANLTGDAERQVMLQGRLSF